MTNTHLVFDISTLLHNILRGTSSRILYKYRGRHCAHRTSWHKKGRWQTRILYCNRERCFSILARKFSDV